MHILFTGASSFTGMWFVKELINCGHSVTATLQGSKGSYQGVRGQRVDQLKKLCPLIFECKFGSDSFLQVIDRQPHFDMLCHHAADVTNYKSPHFNFSKALENNTRNIALVLQKLQEKGCKHLLLTGSIFEENEGLCSAGNKAISPYGLSKSLTAQVFTHFCSLACIAFGKFVIANPFGPYEEERFTSYLIKQWMHRQKALIKTPYYIRDNIPVTLLAKCYSQFANAFYRQNSPLKLNPSYFPQSQKAFTQKFCYEMQKRLNIPCEYECLKQTEFLEPAMRVNTDPIELASLKWEEESFFDELALFYKHTY